jgi:hypothetical protein
LLSRYSTLTPRRIRLLVALSFAALPGCAGTSTAPRLFGTSASVLFIGSSLTSENDLPGIVEAFGRAMGDTLEVETLVSGGFALIDHWANGQPPSAITRRAWSFVVLQQGPSSTTINRDSLRLVTRLYAPYISAAGARAALFSGWPSIERRQDTERASESYRLAAQDVNGLYLPVAAAWLIASEQAPDVKIYQIDGIHPTVEGSYLAAAVIYARLTGRRATGLPGTFTPRFGLRVALHPDVALALQRAADRAIAECCGVP